MPATAEAARTTDAYRVRLIQGRRGMVLAAARLWTLVEGDLEGSFASWLARTDRLTSAAQANAVTLSDAYAAAYAGAELGEAVAPIGIDAAVFAGRTLDGRPLRAQLASALIAVKSALAGGRTFEAASATGRARALRTVSAELDGAADRALDVALDRQPSIRGWRRVSSARACGACLGSVTGAIQKTDSVLLRHPHCRCTKEPVVEGVKESIRRPTGRELFDRMSKVEQDELFAGRGGEAKAELVRSGRVELGDLVSKDAAPISGRPAAITETPLEHLL